MTLLYSNLKKYEKEGKQKRGISTMQQNNYWCSEYKRLGNFP